MTYKERDALVAKLTELRDFVQDHGVEMPGRLYITTQVYHSITATDYVKGEDGEWVTVIDEEKTKENLGRALKAMRNVEKDYKDDKLTINMHYKCAPGHVMINAYVDRSIACKRVVTGKKFVKEQLVPSRFEEEVEWVCDDGLSLLKLVQ